MVCHSGEQVRREQFSQLKMHPLMKSEGISRDIGKQLRTHQVAPATSEVKSPVLLGQELRGKGQAGDLNQSLVSVRVSLMEC